MHVRKISLLKNKEISCTFFCFYFYFLCFPFFVLRQWPNNVVTLVTIYTTCSGSVLLGLLYFFGIFVLLFWRIIASSSLHGLHIMWMGKITVKFFQRRSNLIYLSHARVEWSTSVPVLVQRGDWIPPTNRIFFLSLHAFFTTNIKDRMMRRYVLLRTGIWTVRRTKL